MKNAGLGPSLWFAKFAIQIQTGCDNLGSVLRMVRGPVSLH